MKILASLPLFLLFITCNSNVNDKQVETIQMVIQQAESDNTSLLMKINETIGELGQKEAHLEILERIRKLMALRKKHAYQLNNMGDTGNFEPENLNKFLDEMSAAQAESVISMEVVSQKIDTYRARINVLSESEEFLNDYLIVVNLLYLESEILREYAKYFGHH